MLKPRHWYTLVLVLICSTSQAGTNSWTSTGPEGGPIASAAFHPSDDTAMVVGSARGVHLSLTATQSLVSNNANCDTGGGPPVLNVLDFGCFLNRFAAGCS